ncbi:MAG: carboxylating nicotinate-nucleotide diphosphorylase [Planctomycetales bacterium]|nr:carboxylating nicotinate-nucleotide diphosphorylase [Planctomycetales bacterium]
MPLERRDFDQQNPDEFLRDSLEQLTLLAIREDLARSYDLTTVAVVPPGLPATANIVARRHGVAAGLTLVPWMIETLGAKIDCRCQITDGQSFQASQALATLSGEARDVLTCERIILNFLGKLCGIASLTQQYVELIRDLPVRLYDTRKTTPGYRQLEKYAVRCGGGRNHRQGLYDAILIKDNHLACHQRVTGQLLSPSQAICQARSFLEKQPDVATDAIVEIEVDTLLQLADALTASPDIVLLDNMTNEQLCEAVRMRNETDRAVELEASGGVRLDSLRGIAESGVDRISVGALTHSAVNLDLGLDWQFENS